MDGQTTTTCGGILSTLCTAQRAKLPRLSTMRVLAGEGKEQARDERVSMMSINSDVLIERLE